MFRRDGADHRAAIAHEVQVGAAQFHDPRHSLLRTHHRKMRFYAFEQLAMVERMLTVIRFSRPLPDSPDFSYTCSAGIAACVPSDSASDLYRRADQALYAAKLSGRDRVRAA